MTQPATAAPRVTVMGSGSWGTAFALVLTDAQNQVTLWARRPELAERINAEHRNPDYFPTIALPPSLRAVSDPEQAMDGADFVVLAVPSQSLRANLERWSLPEAADRGEPGQGHRAGHRAADERGDRRGRRGRARTGSRW